MPAPTRLLREHMSHDDAIEMYSDQLAWVSELDDWASPEDWLRLANRYRKGSYPSYQANAILRDYGEVCPKIPSLEKLKKVDPHHEVNEAWVRQIWELRNTELELARRWFMPELDWAVPFGEQRAEWGDPLAIYDLLAPYAAQDGSATECDEVRAWRTNHHLAGPHRPDDG